MKKRLTYQSFSFRKGAIKLCHSAWLLTLAVFLLSIQVSASSTTYGESSFMEDESLNPMTSQQKIVVTGTIISAFDKLALPGATIIEKGVPLNGTTSNIDGKFTLAVSGENAILRITFIGMKSLEVPINANGTPLEIMMEEDNFSLEEVIVTGYGIIKKEAYAGSASIIKMDKLSDVPVSSIGTLLQGSASGVQVTNSSGQPGASTQIRIRGIGSFNASNDPLYVIDGVPVISGNLSSLGTHSGLDILSTISSSSIESISVIKDAAAASLYGSRAANGVIIITTKKGISGAAKVNFKSEIGFSDFATDYRPFMGGQERRETIYEGLVNEGIYYKAMDQTAAQAYADANIDRYAKLPWTGEWTDWKSILFRKGQYTNNEVSVSGGTDKIKYFSSLGYTDQEGISVMGYMKRISGRLNLSFEASKRLSIGTNLLFSSVEQSTNTEGTTYIGPFYSTFNSVTSRDVPFLEDGSYAYEFPRNGTGRNPKAYADLNYQIENVMRAFNTVYANYNIMQGLDFKSSLSYDFNMIKGKYFTHPLSSYPANLGTLSKSVYDRRSTVWSNSMQYVKTINKDHNLDALVAYEITDFTRDFLYGSKENLANWNMVELDNFSVVRSVDGSANGYRMLSYVSRVNYDYKGRYYAGASFRRDGSSRLAPESRWGNFWSLSGAWRVSDESFMEGLTDIFPEVKLRASYGVNGTLPSGYYDYMGLSSYGAEYNALPGIVETQFLNSNLKWETNYNTNIGLDFSIYDKVRVSFEYYNRLTKDLLMNEPVSLSTGFSSILSNIGEMRNRGFELELVSTIINKKDLNWTSSFNISHNKNEILVLDGVQQSIISGTQIRMVGKPYYTFYLREFAGIDPTDGRTMFYTNTIDANGNYVKETTKELNTVNAIPLESAEPKLIGGFTNNFKYKFIDFGFTFTYSLGGHSYDAAAGKLDKEGTTNGLHANIPTYYSDRWRKPGDESIYGIYIANNKWDMADGYSNSRRIHSTDHIRLKNISLGITLPSKVTDYLKLEKIRIFASASNIWTLAKWKMYDPEVGSDGVMAWQTPQLKTVTFGIDVNF
ncbi:MAG: TonB-dependent receptor [Bacteroidetes bacterium]|nr:TonB-dependent receptor [Bacteroidota bacterium]